MINVFSTMVKTAVASNKDSTFKNAMKEYDSHEFVKAMVKEISEHKAQDHWIMMERRELSPRVKTIMSIWSFRQKCYPNDRLNKHKACIFIHGGQQTCCQNYWETYAPVVNWTSVRLLLAVAKIHNLPSKGIDFPLTFPQSDLDIPVYMELSMGFEYKDNSNQKKYVLRLNVSLYGLKQSSYNWFAKLKTGLKGHDFVQSSVDPVYSIVKDVLS